MGLQLHPTIGNAGSPHLNRLFVSAHVAAYLGDSRELGRYGGSIGYQSPDLSGDQVSYLGLGGSIAFSLETYDLYIDSPLPEEFEGSGLAPGLVARGQLSFGPVEVGFNLELAYLLAAKETSKIGGITLGLALF